MKGPPAVVPEVGDVVADKYRIEAILGQGGMGTVLSARHVDLGHRVAIKVIFYDAGSAGARFLREARACAQLQSEHVARVYDVGRLPSGAPYLVMEHLSGVDLAAVARRGPLPVADAVSYVLQACAGLVEAHALGVVHRDLKPANLFLTTRGDGSPLVKVLDFGISKVMRPDALDDLSLTSSTAFLGSPLYMSPEQIRASKDVDHRTDVWSTGIILYQLLTGRMPFDGASAPALCVAIANDAPPRPSSVRADIPPALEAAILRCLEKDRARRFADLGGLAIAIAPFAHGHTRTLSERVARIAGGGMRSEVAASRSESASAPAAERTNAPWSETRGANRPRGGALALSFGLGGLLAAAAAAGVVAWRAMDGRDAASAPAASRIVLSASVTPEVSAAPPVSVTPTSLAIASTSPSVVAVVAHDAAVPRAPAAQTKTLAGPAAKTSAPPGLGLSETP